MGSVDAVCISHLPFPAQSASTSHPNEFMSPFPNGRCTRSVASMTRTRSTEGSRERPWFASQRTPEKRRGRPPWPSGV